jgi:two-component system chemotaxis response regulator CheB
MSRPKIKLVKRISKPNIGKTDPAKPQELRDIKNTKIKHLAIGASTGGPPVILDILKQLPPNFNVPIYIVQHIVAGFLEGFVAWLKSSTGHEIMIAENGIMPQPGKIYVAASEYNTGIKANGLFELRRDNPNSLLCPSVSFLFGSLSKYFAPSSVGILLTGMGKDGAAELKDMRDAAKHILSPDEIVKALKILIY